MALFLFAQTFFQGIGVQRRQVDLGEAVFGGEDEAFGQVIAGDHLAVFFSQLQKVLGALGIGGVVQVKDAQDAFVPDGEVIADG